MTVLEWSVVLVICGGACFRLGQLWERRYTRMKEFQRAIKAASNFRKVARDNQARATEERERKADGEFFKLIL